MHTELCGLIQVCLPKDVMSMGSISLETVSWRYCDHRCGGGHSHSNGVCARARVCMYVCMYVCTHVCTHVRD